MSLVVTTKMAAKEAVVVEVARVARNVGTSKKGNVFEAVPAGTSTMKVVVVVEIVVETVMVETVVETVVAVATVTIVTGIDIETFVRYVKLTHMSELCQTISCMLRLHTGSQ